MSTHQSPQTRAPRNWRGRDLPREREHGPRRPPNEPGSSRLRGWRGDVFAASGLNVLAGIWLIIAPFVLGYGSGDPYWNDIA